MFKRRTLFVLGAGASQEVGLPLGKGLADLIGSKMDIRFERIDHHIGTGDIDLFNNVTNRMRRDHDEFLDAASILRNGLGFAQSIDDFLDQHRDNPHVNEYGKAAIVRAILQAEHDSALYIGEDTGIDKLYPAKFANTWLLKFMYMLGRGIPRSNAPEIFDQLAFIVFNYDRCLEHFLRHALKQLYKIPDQHAQNIVDNLTIIHPYGVIPQVRFGYTRANYVDLAHHIKTYTDQIANADLKKEITEELYRADAIVFLGFAFHAQNMELLKPSVDIKPKPIYGTAYGMSDADTEVTLHQLTDFFDRQLAAVHRRSHIKLENKLTSAALFDYYAKSLSGGD